MEVLCIIPARGGSKAVPKKNLTQINGETLFYHAAECIKNSKTITRSVVSTDSDEIANHAKELGLEVPFVRPREFAKDDTTDWPVFNHCLEWLDKNEGYRPDIVVHLRVTSPFAFRRVQDSKKEWPHNWEYLPRERAIDETVALLQSKPDWDSVRSVEVVRDTPFKMWQIEEGRLVSVLKGEQKEIYNQPRQKIPPVYLQNGYSDVAWAKTIREKQSMNGDAIGSYILESDYLIDIDRFSDIDLGNLVSKEILEGSFIK